MNRDLLIAIFTSASLHAAALLFGGKLFGTERAMNTAVALPPPVQTVLEEEALPPPPKNEDIESESEEESIVAESTASLPEPPSSLSLDAAMLQEVQVRPVVPPRPNLGVSSSVPVRRQVGAGTEKGRYKQIFSTEDLDRPLQPRVKTPPNYPLELQRLGLSGSAEVLILIDEKGNVVEAKTEHTTHPLFGQAAVAAAMKWKFRPPLRKGKPVSVRALQKIPFNLK